MAKLNITDFFIYKWRYILGYTIVGLALIAALTFAGFYAPGALSQQEMNAVVKTDQLDFSSLDSIAVTNLPFHLLQEASFSLLGVTQISIKLPALILGFLSAVGMIILLRRWFSPGVAVLASVLAVTTGQFIFLAQHGTSGILYVFWPITLLLLATLIAGRVKPGFLWKVLFFITAALSLYTPLSIYVLIALGSAVLLHPHLRYLARRLSKARVIVAAALAATLLVPLAWGIVKDPGLGLRLLGVPNEWPNLLANVQTLGTQYFGFMTIGDGALMTPVFGLGSMLIIGYGLWVRFRTRETVQSYVILTWLICLLPVLLINPLFTSITFVPLLLLLATGIYGIQRNWYKLFPRNPYARFAGLIPLIVLTSSLVLFGLERYAYGYHYAPATMQHFTRDLQLLPDDTTDLVVSSDEKAFYDSVAKYREELNVTTTTPTGNIEYVSTRAAHERSDKIPHRVIVDLTGSKADRFYIYKSDSE